MKAITILFCVIIVLGSCKETSSKKEKGDDYLAWENYAGTKDGARYSLLDQINKGNVQDLKVAWTYTSNDKDTNNRSQNQCNPIIVDGVLYGTSPKSKLFALNAKTGKQLWSFDPATIESTTASPNKYYNIIRGVVYWENERGEEQRIFYSAGQKTFCVDAKKGTLVTTFGKEGCLDLSENLNRPEKDFNPFIASTSPGITYGDLLVVSMRVAETADAAPGHIRAYDTRSGKLRWVFHTIPHPGEFGYESWPDKEAWKKLGGANNWAGMSLDSNNGILYVPTGSVSGDFYGGFRKGTNLFGNSLIALEASSGKYLWHYQIVHHDLWDRDLSANPNLVTLTKEGKTLEAVAQITKHGYIFVFDRKTGEPVFPIEEIPVPQNALPGEEPWPTQPIPALPEPFARQKFTEEDVGGLDPEQHEELLEKFKMIRNVKKFSPPSKEGGWIFPGFDGGGEWGGAAFDPETQVMYVNSTELPWSLTMIDVPKDSGEDISLKGIGNQVYNKYCLACHGPDRKGNGESFPSLNGISDKYSNEHILDIIENGKNRMPAFGQLKDNEKTALLAFLQDIPDKEAAITSDLEPKEEAMEETRKKSIMDEVPYTMTGYNRFLDKNGYPGITPPWGTLNAVDLSSGKLVWKVPLGEYKELSEKGIPPTGTENYGGPVVTKGGLVFIAATKDSKIRAFDKDNGKILWEANLPVPGFATPAVYEVDGRQFVVIACGGGKIGSKSGDRYIAFSFPSY